MVQMLGILWPFFLSFYVLPNTSSVSRHLSSSSIVIVPTLGEVYRTCVRLLATILNLIKVCNHATILHITQQQYNHTYDYIIAIYSSVYHTYVQTSDNDNLLMKFYIQYSMGNIKIITSTVIFFIADGYCSLCVAMTTTYLRNSKHNAIILVKTVMFTLSQ